MSKWIGAAASAGIALSVMMLASPSRAQFGSAFVPTSFSQEGTIHPHLITANVFYTAFAGSGDGESATLPGVLFSLEDGFVLGGGSDSAKKSSFKIGGWLFRGNWKDETRREEFGNVAYYELHGKYYFAPQYGIQVGVLGARDKTGTANSKDLDAFALYNFFKGGADSNTGHSSVPYALQLGLGGYKYADVSSPRITAFLQGSVELRKYLSFDISSWYINSPSGGYEDRYVAGLGYRF